MIKMPLGGTDAHFAVDDSIISSIKDGGAQAVKVAIDVSGEKLTSAGSVPSGSLDDTFQALQGMLEDNSPCLILVVLKDGAGSLPSAGEKDLGLVAYTPAEAPAKLKMLGASCRKTLRESLAGYSFKEYNASEKAEVSFAAYTEATRDMTDAERKDAMSREELEREEISKQVGKELQTAPKMMAGMAALAIEAEASFEEGCAAVCEGGRALIGRITAETKLAGEVIEGVNKPTELAGKLPSDEPCYVILKSQDVGLVLVSWLPDGVPARVRMKFSSFKASVVAIVKKLTNVEKLPTGEVTEEADLSDEIGVAAAPEDEPAAAEEKPRPGGFRPPVGGMALPGMGPK